MDNLSGGEKTVAALALLFAIHRFAVEHLLWNCLMILKFFLQTARISKLGLNQKIQVSLDFQCTFCVLMLDFSMKITIVLSAD